MFKSLVEKRMHVKFHRPRMKKSITNREPPILMCGLGPNWRQAAWIFKTSNQICVQF